VGFCAWERRLWSEVSPARMHQKWHFFLHMTFLDHRGRGLPQGISLGRVIMHYWANTSWVSAVLEHADTKCKIDKNAAICLESDSHPIICLQWSSQQMRFQILAS
jgi:hypothetical protein